MLRAFDPGLGVIIHALRKHQLNHLTLPLGRCSKTSPLPMYYFSSYGYLEGLKEMLVVFFGHNTKLVDETA